MIQNLRPVMTGTYRNPLPGRKEEYTEATKETEELNNWVMNMKDQLHLRNE